MPSGFHDGSRSLQDRFDTRALADRIDALLVSDTISDGDRAFIQDRDMFFLATADAEGRPTCSYKGGEPGFVRVLDAHTLAFPNYDGNGMYLSTGNVLVNPAVGMLFIDFERGHRMRLEGTATIDLDDPLRARLPGGAVRRAGDRPGPSTRTARGTSTATSWCGGRGSSRAPTASPRCPSGSVRTGRATPSPSTTRPATPATARSSVADRRVSVVARLLRRRCGAPAAGRRLDGHEDAGPRRPLQAHPGAELVGEVGEPGREAVLRDHRAAHRGDVSGIPHDPGGAAEGGGAGRDLAAHVAGLQLDGVGVGEPLGLPGVVDA